MHNRMPSRRRQAPGSSPARQDNTVPVQGEPQQRTPRMPYERDESADSQAAHDDLEPGLVDTDKGPALDKAYEKVREGTAEPAKKFRP